jgi:bacillolysin
MQQKSKLIVLILLTFGFFFTGTFKGISQEKTNDQEQKKTPPRLLKFNESQRVSLQNPNQLLKNIFDTSDKTSFTTIKQEVDKIGYSHLKTQQYYNNIKVEFGTLTLHSKNGMVESISSEFYKIEDLNTSPNISNIQAFNRAVSHTGANAYLWEDEAASNELGYSKPEGELVILPVYEGSSTSMKLAYKFDIYTISPMGGGDLYIDAQNGQALFFNNKVRHLDNFGHDGRAFHSDDEILSTEIIVEKFETIASGTAATRYSGSRTIETSLSGGNYILSDAGRKVYTRNANNLAPVGNSLPYITSYSQFTDADNNWTAAEYDNNDKDNAALDAHWGAMETYDYWSSVHGRDSYDGNGAQLRSYVHVDNNYDNAFWFLNVMSYGDGSSNGNEGNGYFDALTSIDVAAHEIGHAVTEYTANLAYQRESGGINEGYSDIWGAAVEHFAKGNGNDANPDASIWLIGDEIDRRNGSAALRSMSNPTSLGQPDTYGGTYWQNPNCGTPTQSNDYCGVHTNSGVLNYWFYLTVAGGNGTNDIGNSFSVSGIGMTKAAKISYRAINNYLSANSTYADARTAMIQSAQDLYGADGAEEQGVTNAWYAVGVGDAYGGGTPTTCYTGDISLSITFDNYPEETAWTLKNSSGTTVASASYSNANPDGSTINETFTGLVVDDYTFTITDAYGDGICCSYGSGSYSLSTSSGDFKTGGDFGSSEATPFCIEAGSGGDTEAPSTPTNLTASNITETTATLSWNASSDNVGVTGYDVYQGTTNIGNVTGTSANITGLTASTSYTFSIRAIDAAGNESAASNAVNFNTSSGVDTQAPSAPTSLSASNITQTTVDLSWNASTDNIGVTGYDVYQGTTNIGNVTGTSANITGLTASTSYTFSVRAKDTAGNESASSNTVNITTESSGGGGSTVLNESYFESGWDSWVDGGSDSYRYSGSRSYEGNRSIRIRDNTNSSVMTLSNVDVTSYSSIDIEFYFYSYSMENGEDFWVQYHDGSSWNTVASYARGTNFENNNFYSATVTINSGSYNFPSNARFRFRNDASGNNDHIYIDQVSITGNPGASNLTNSITTLGPPLNGILGDEDFEFESDFLLYPNPVKDNLSIKLAGESQNATFRIVNMIGQEVLSGELNKGTVNVENLNTGVYFMEVNDGEELMIQRFIKE